ncbi:MAG: hypothetical protein KIT09_14705 [Bryobacteraceae bacterium]|nr:hypothetical protein [Bryobacteraceae bacterium]
MEPSRQPELSDEIDLLRKYVEQAAAPVRAATLRKDMRAAQRWKRARTDEIANAAVAAGVVFAWGSGRNPRYWRREAGEFLRERVLEAASEVALPKTELAKRASRAAHDAGPKQAGAAIAELLKEGALKQVKAIVGGGTLFHTASVPEALLRASAEALVAKFRTLGMDAAQVAQAFRVVSSPEHTPLTAPPAGPAAETDVAERALQILRQLQGGPAVPVTVYRLRAAMPEASKPELDRAVMALAATQRVYLTRHDHGWALPEDERERLVHDGGANLYVAITIRD